MRSAILKFFLIFVFPLFVLPLKANTYEVDTINLLSINSAITPATFDYLQHHFKSIGPGSIAVIRMNTPGGLLTTTKDIITLIGNQKFPVTVWITPEGASAASAGAIIASSAHFILMSPGSNMGAATPVGLGEDLKESDGRNKAINDLSALVRSLSQSRGRPASPFEDMIKTASSVTDKEALKLKIIDGIATKSADLESVLNQKTFSLQGVSHTINFKNNFSFKELTPTLGQQILEVLTDPSLAYFLFLIGIALIYFEFQAPGGYVSGLVGMCFLILAGIAFQVLPLDLGSLGLIILGIVFLILEIFITSYGILTLSGIVSFVFGSLFLFHGDSGFISIEYPVLLSTLAGVFIAVGIIVWYLYQDKKKQHKVADFFLPIGAQGTIVTKNAELNQYQIKVRGEIWKASGESNFEIGEHVEVQSIDQEHLMVFIKKI